MQHPPLESSAIIVIYFKNTADRSAFLCDRVRFVSLIVIFGVIAVDVVF